MRYEFRGLPKWVAGIVLLVGLPGLLVLADRVGGWLATK